MSLFGRLSSFIFALAWLITPATEALARRRPHLRPIEGFDSAKDVFIVAFVGLIVIVAVVGFIQAFNRRPDTRPLCPDCGATMVRRTARKGKHAGQDFWGCAKFPRCRGVVAQPHASGHQGGGNQRFRIQR